MSPVVDESVESRPSLGQDDTTKRVLVVQFRLLELLAVVSADYLRNLPVDPVRAKSGLFDEGNADPLGKRT
jgi:hypothetical protein